MNLNQITLPAYDLAKTVQFYQQLGCLLIVDSPHYARFESPAGDATFSLSAQQKKASSDASVGDNNASQVTIYFEVDDVDQTVADLEKKGLVFTQQASDMTYLWREAILVDPSGNHIKIYHAGENRRFPPWRVSS